MLKRLGILWLCLLFALRCSATLDFIQTERGKRFCITLPTWAHIGGVGGSLKFSQLLYLLQKSENEIIPADKFVLINFGVHRNFIDGSLKPSKREFTLSCETGKYVNTVKGILEKKDIVIINVTDKISAEACLRLVLYGVSHFEEIRKQQKFVLSLCPRYYSLETRADIIIPNTGGSLYGLVHSLADTQIQNVLSKKDLTVEKMVQQKFYFISLGKYPFDYGTLDCYTQNDSCFIYEKGKDSTNIFSSKQLIGLSSDRRNNYIAFVDEEHFYHIAMPARKVSGPYTVAEPKMFAIVNYGILDDSLYTRNDTIFFSIHPDYSSGEGGRLKFHLPTGCVSIDSSSLSENTKAFIQRKKEENNQKLAAIKEAEAFAMRKYYALILVCFVVVLNLFLTFSKKL